MTIPLRTEQIVSQLNVLEQDPTLLQESNFLGRVAAISFLETHIIQWMEVEPGLGEPPDDRGNLMQQARALATRLEEVNTRMFRALESRIAAGDCRGAALRGELIRCAGRPSPWEASGREPIYDHLDLLVAGLLRMGAPPDESGEREPEMVPYQPTPARVILEIIDRAPVRPNDIFYDLGSGLGQVPILVNLLTGARARGIETEPAYCAYAGRCAERLNLPDVHFVNRDARTADYSDGTVFYLYTPFVGGMLRQVMGRLQAQAVRRRIRVCTYGPCTQPVSRQAWLRCLTRVSGDPEFEIAIFEGIWLATP
jgi:SAM-dependent methyltransferase